MSKHNEDWVDFTHSTQISEMTARELFERFREFQEFIGRLPRRELVARGWLETVDDDSPLANVFFEIPFSKQATLFRKSVKADENLLAIWQARARAQAEHIFLAEGRPAFTGLTKERLRKLATLSVD